MVIIKIIHLTNAKGYYIMNTDKKQALLAKYFSGQTTGGKK
jgi:hypothetical protein